MNPLTAIYDTGVSLRNRMYDGGRLRSFRLQSPVVSIGSISAGGAGKTPFLIMLGELLKQRGVTLNVLSRGYGRRTSGVALVDPSGTPEEFGDEPLLIARKLAVPVIVGADRYAAGKVAEEEFGHQLHLLDDGFQHRRLGRDFDIALISEHELKDSLLPAGRLREPMSSLARVSRHRRAEYPCGVPGVLRYRPAEEFLCRAGSIRPQNRGHPRIPRSPRLPREGHRVVVPASARTGRNSLRYHRKRRGESW